MDTARVSNRNPCCGPLLGVAVVVALCCGWTCSEPAAGAGEPQQANLRRLVGVRVAVSVNSDFPVEPVRREALERLRLAHVPVLDDDAEWAAAGEPMLTLSIGIREHGSTACSVTAAVTLTEHAALLRTGRNTRATTWRSGWFLTYESGGDFRGSCWATASREVQKQLNEFIQDYRSVNRTDSDAPQTGQ
jgi:hypothetical protein